MNGPINLLVDTKALIALLNGDSKIRAIADRADSLFVSIISVIEFLSWNELTITDHHNFDAFLEDVAVIGIADANDPVVLEAASLRRTSKLRLPDAIIAASAIVNSCELVTADRHFVAATGLKVISP